MSKAAKKRFCPALGHEISSAECGTNRVSHYACPADCHYLPFAPSNYSQLLELEGKLDNQCMDRLLQHPTDGLAMERALLEARYRKNAHAMHAFYEWNFFFARGGDGRTWAERWEQSSATGLKNDELVLLRAKMQTRVALVEIHRVLDGERMEAVDLLQPGTPTLRLHDRSLASIATRFATALAWIYPLPHYWRLNGTAIIMPNMGQFDPVDIVAEIVRHLGGPATEPEMRLWLAKNFVHFDESLMATSRMRQMQMYSGSDARFGKAVYELQAPFVECRNRLAELPQVEPDHLSSEESGEGFAEARVWFEEAGESKYAVPPGAQPVLGRVLLGQAHWRVEAMGGKRLAQLRQRFEAQMGTLARFTGERIDDLSPKPAGSQPVADKSLVPPRLLENPQQLAFTSSRVPALPPGTSREEAEAELMRAADRQFLDDQVPALDNHTPREAARDPALRPKLIRLLKERVNGQDQRNLQNGRQDDINWLLRELGADEIIFEPPPWRPPQEPLASEDDLFDDGIIGGHVLLPPALSLPAEPLSMQEAERRLKAGMARFQTAGDALDSLEASGMTIIGDIEEITVDFLDEEAFAMAIGFVLEAVLTLVPPGHQAPPTNFEALQINFSTNLNELTTQLKKATSEAIFDYLDGCSQPNLMRLLAGQILSFGRKTPEALGPSIESQPVILAVVRTVIDELDHVLRP
jgi:hypothetical protein